MRAEATRSRISTVVTIVVLAGAAVIATYLWHNHIVTDRLRRALESTAAAKVVVMEAATVHGGLTGLTASELSYNAAASISPYVARIKIIDGGRISVLTKNTGATPDIQFILVPSDVNGTDEGAITWTCLVATGRADLMPAGCRRGPPADRPNESPSAPATGRSVIRQHAS